jgi:abhydrolase domain-containing protein 6
MKKWILIIASAAAGVLLAAVVVITFFPGHAFEIAIKLERCKSGLEEKSVDVDGVHYAYLIGGQGEPLVMVHGFAASKDHWVRVAKYLGRHFAIIAPDLPGCGKSTKDPNLDYTIDKQVERLRAFTQALGLESFDLAGNSMGGAIAGVYAARYPESVKSLWLLDPGWVQGARPSEMHQLMKKGANVLVPRSAADFDRISSMCFVNPPYMPGFIKNYSAERYIANAALYANIFDQLIKEPTCLECELSESATPTLIMWGEKDRLTHVSGAEVLAAKMPNARLVILKNVGHIPMMEKPGLAAQHYLEFRGVLQ